MAQTDLKISLLSAILLTLSFPPFPFGFLAPIALALLLNHFINHRPRNSFAVAYVQGVFWGTFTLYWVSANTLVGGIMTILISALQYGLFWWLFLKLYDWRKITAFASFPVLWTVLEFGRQYSDLRFTWLNLAYTQTYYLYFIQFIEWTGYLGLTFLVSTLAVLVYLVFFLKTKRVLLSGIGIALIVLPVSFGIFRVQQLSQLKMPTVTAGIVQPNVDPYKKWETAFKDSAFVMLAESTKELAAKGARLVIWPETATPFFLRYEPRYLQQIHQLTDSLDIDLLMGTPDVRLGEKTGDYKTFNSAFFFQPRIPGFQKYNKMALVPVAESIPFKLTFPFLRNLNLGGGDFFPGKDFKVFQTSISFAPNGKTLSRDGNGPSTLKISSVICFESVFPHLVRQFVAKGANLLAIITNDGWFGITSGPVQHAQYAILRAVENRISIVRSANTGISMFIDFRGKVLERTSLWEKIDIIRNIPIHSEKTFYTVKGEWFGVLNLIILLIIFSAYVFDRFRNKKV